MNEIVDIPGLGKRRLVEGRHYDYKADKSKCPMCGRVGTPWRGWFSCDCCPAVALVDSGEVFMPWQEEK